MPGLPAFIKCLSEEADVGQRECKKVLVALNTVLAREVRATGVFTIPRMLIIRKKRTPPKQAGPRKVFGKMVEAKAKPETVRLKIIAVKKLREEILIK